MADLTLQMELTGKWAEIGAGLGLEDGETYVADVTRAPGNATLHYADTDSPDPPSAAIVGHPWDPAAAADRGRVYTRDAAVFTWVRLDRGSGLLVASKV